MEIIDNTKLQGMELMSEDDEFECYGAACRENSLLFLTCQDRHDLKQAFNRIPLSCTTEKAELLGTSFEHDARNSNSISTSLAPFSVSLRGCLVWFCVGFFIQIHQILHILLLIQAQAVPSLFHAYCYLYTLMKLKEHLFAFVMKGL